MIGKPHRCDLMTSLVYLMTSQAKQVRLDDVTDLPDVDSAEATHVSGVR